MRPFRLSFLLFLSGCVTLTAPPATGGFRQPDPANHPDLYVWADTCNVYVIRDGEAALLIGVLRNTNSPAAGDVLKGEFVVNRPGPKWGISVMNRSGQALNSTGSNHWVRYVGLNPEVQ